MEEVIDNAKILELESTAKLPILAPAHARIKLAAKYWARVGRLVNDMCQRPDRAKAAEALDLLARFRKMPDNPILRGKDGDKMKQAMNALEEFFKQIHKEKKI